MNYWLPRPNYCSLHFLQQILSDEKQVLNTTNVSQRNLNELFPELAVKNVWPLVKGKQLDKYLPTAELEMERHCDKKFFWGVAFTITPEWAEEYYQKIKRSRKKEKKVAKKVIKISAKHRDLMLKHDFKSKSK